MKSERQIAVEALTLAGNVLSTFTDRGSIGAIDNVLRSRWQDRTTVKGWWTQVGALTDGLDPPAVPVEFCNWCPDPPRPDPRWHPNGQRNHVEPSL